VQPTGLIKLSGKEIDMPYANGKVKPYGNTTKKKGGKKK
jgi:hypothetical protein